ncbi:MAG: hypothetical protein K8T26_03120 [Lentisphaerae bacterium]|nr:hypothetical protein [Lentisphaerota bacterium]
MALNRERLRRLARRLKQWGGLAQVGDGGRRGPPCTAPAMPDLSSLPKGRLVCGKVPADFRDFQRVDAVKRWATSHGIDFSTVEPGRLADLDWTGTAAVWMPFINPDENLTYETRCLDLARIPPTVPLILDIKSKADHPWLVPIRQHLGGRPLACRHVSPSAIADLFQLKVQYNHWPEVGPPAEPRDVVMVDIHRWEDASRHIQVLGLLEQFARDYDAMCAKAGCALKFYLTSFTALDPYADSLRALSTAGYGRPNVQGPGADLLAPVRTNLLPAAPTREGFVAMLGRTRFFVSFHHNLSDMLVFEALANEIPTLIVPEQAAMGRMRKLWIPDRQEVPGYDAWARQVEERLEQFRFGDYSFLKESATHFGSCAVLENAFNFAWGRLWLWVAQAAAKNAGTARA